MDLSRLSDLKDKLAAAETLSEIWDFFFDNFGEDPDFIALGKPKRVPLVRNILRMVAKQLYGEGAELRSLHLTVLREQRFAHGTCSLGGHLTTVLYFGDLGMGSLASTDPSTGMTRFVRFTKMGVAPAPADGDEATLPLPPGSREVN